MLSAVSEYPLPALAMCLYAFTRAQRWWVLRRLVRRAHRRDLPAIAWALATQGRVKVMNGRSEQRLPGVIMLC